MRDMLDDARLLIIDDDALTRLLAAEALRESGFTVFEADCGEEGLRMYCNVEPDLVLLDVMMPGIDGFEVCRRLREGPRGERLPIIMLTGLEDTSSIERAYDEGATDFISKPINWTLLRHRVRYVLRSANLLDELVRSEDVLANAQRIGRMGSWEWRPDGDLLQCSDTYLTLFGEDVTTFGDGHDAVVSRVYPADRGLLRDALGGARHGRAYQLEYRIVRPDGAVRTMQEIAVPVFDSAGAVSSVQGTLQDITDRIEAERRIRYLAYFDSLTGLPNRQSFRETLDAMVLRAGRRSDTCAVMFLDMDRFGRINESLGQDCADQVLQLIAARLRDFSRFELGTGLGGESGDDVSVARLGGDEFALMLEGNIDENALIDIASRLLTQLQRPVRVGGHDLTLSACVGISIFPVHAGDADSLMKCAETAVSQSKREGSGGVVQLFTEQMKIASFAKLSLENSLRRGLERGELRMHYQAKVDAVQNCIVGAEALVRWAHPERGLVSPAEFIPLAEEVGLIISLSEWVVREVCRQYAEWRADGLNPPPVSINLSAGHFRHVGLLELIDEALARHRIEPQQIEFELTESSLMRDAELTDRILNGFRERGLRIAVDDFGTGYSSLAYLKRFALNVVKIDRSFVNDIEDDPSDAAIVAAIVAMTRTLGIEVVAEGVETHSQAQHLVALGCNVMQSYLYSRPASATDFEALLRDGLPRLAA